MKEWDDNTVAANPFWEDWRSPLRDLPTGEGSRFVRIDPAHTYAIDGIGKSFLASSLILLCHFGYFGFGKIEVKLNNAYAPFIAYCEARGKHTTILEFSSKTLKLPQNSHLGIILRKKFVNTPQIPIVS